MIVPVILSGGSGTRLWPLSRKLHPKQFIDLVNDTTLFQDTILRLPKDVANPLIICNEEHRFLAAEQLRQIDKESNGIILEPIGKNTAPAIALAALHELNQNRDSYLLVLSADHVIKNIQAFHQAIDTALELSKQGDIVTFGIKPNKAETGYGYIKTQYNNPQKVEKFIEKPDQETADKYFNSQEYLWNSGMFVFKASVYINELKKFEPEILSCCKRSCTKEYQDLDFIRLQESEFIDCPSLSIDYAILEHSDKVSVVSADIDWSDVGSWGSLWEQQSKDQQNNVIKGLTYTQDTNGCYISASDRVVATIGVSNLAIIDTKDSILVAQLNQAQNIKTLVENIQKQHVELTEDHPKVLRPWGHYETIIKGDNFQVKKIVVKPKQRLSLQKHQHRSEHWVVVRGQALVTNDSNIFDLKTNQSTYIPARHIHRLENAKDDQLEIIEIQTGSYLGEDDIIRFEDDYQRS